MENAFTSQQIEQKIRFFHVSPFDQVSSDSDSHSLNPSKTHRVKSHSYFTKDCHKCTQIHYYIQVAP